MLCPEKVIVKTRCWRPPFRQRSKLTAGLKRLQLDNNVAEEDLSKGAQRRVPGHRKMSYTSSSAALHLHRIMSSKAEVLERKVGLNLPSMLDLPSETSMEKGREMANMN
jgi:hypothetical protein